MLTVEEVMRMDMEERLRATEFAVEDVDSYARLMLWREWAEEAERTSATVIEGHRRVGWKQINDGWSPAIGTLAGRPVCVSLLWCLIEGRLVLFYYGCSQVVDHKMIGDWAREHLPKVYTDVARNRTSDSRNFGNIVHAIRDLNERKSSNGPVV